jgi:hypothetical protein
MVKWKALCDDSTKRVTVNTAMRGREGRQRTAHGNNISSQFWVMQLQ